MEKINLCIEANVLLYYLMVYIPFIVLGTVFLIIFAIACLSGLKSRYWIFAQVIFMSCISCRFFVQILSIDSSLAAILFSFSCIVRCSSNSWSMTTLKCLEICSREGIEVSLFIASHEIWFCNRCYLSLIGCIFRFVRMFFLTMCIQMDVIIMLNFFMNVMFLMVIFLDVFRSTKVIVIVLIVLVVIWVNYFIDNLFL